MPTEGNAVPLLILMVLGPIVMHKGGRTQLWGPQSHINLNNCRNVFFFFSLAFRLELQFYQWGEQVQNEPLPDSNALLKAKGEI